MPKNAKAKFKEAARLALSELDDLALEALTFTIEAHVIYKRKMGYSAAEGIRWKSDLAVSEPQ